MNYKLLSTTICLVFGSFLAVSSSAQAASFTTDVQYANPNASDADKAKGDIFLKSIQQNNQKITDFSYVNKTVIQYNSPRDKDVNSGAASTDLGDKATTPKSILKSEDPQASEITAYLNNNNLNNIVDTEDTGTFKLDFFFDSLLQADNSGLDSIFFWERGMNSDLLVQGIDAAGKVNAKSYKISETRKNYAGYSIDTQEIGDAQKVGSWGLSLKDLGVTSLSGIRVSAFGTKTEYGNGFNGPDFKVVARKSASVPEPANVIGLGVVATLAFLRRRQSKQTYS